ncbi:CHASE domain-containing protein [Varunaivibrio sulfuroxidans]|uniref:histidine kinase n=1 Tax=Varunaivibrio sulfuroxidans TaxID=1773489 RepID=A0A4V2UNW8_9PROT|nr:CHASE domain-containing protein [Varunaivibrio sulfuroxidans]TCS63671.1 PAS domain S-box-containing protein [Varunaivibrio sulfuroxidans]WES30192.1 CHASE domain-containing protein [Varunaivibrio sulfuroxidans]
MEDQKSSSFRRWALQSSAVALAYVVTGKISLLLAIPPGYATAIWPPAGIALAAVLVYGYRSWVGVFLGSFFVNVLTGFDTRTEGAVLTSFLVPVGIAFGAALQAVGGAYCVRRFARFPNQLSTEREIFLLLFWGGVVSCFVSAGVGTAVLMATGKIPESIFLLNFGTWWIGDAIGVAVFTPLVLVWTLRPVEVWMPRRFIVTVPITIALALTVSAVSIGSNWERQRIKLQFDQQASPLAPALQKTLNSYLGVLYSLKGFYAAFPHGDRDNFRTFTHQSLSVLTGLQALSWNPRISGNERADFENRMHREGYPDFHIIERNAEGKMVPAANRSEYIVVDFIEPLAENRKVLGFDVASNPKRKKALERARDTGRPTVTSRITLVQEKGNQFGFLVFMPVYLKGRPHDTLEDRRLNLAGYMVGVFRGGDIVNAALQDMNMGGLVYRLIDVTNVPSGVFLTENRPPEHGSSTLVDEGFFGGSMSIGRSFPIDFGGRKWEFKVSPSEDYIARHRQGNTWMLLIGGMALTSLVGMFVMVVSGRSALLRNLVAERTDKLAQSEKHVRAIVDSALDGIITTNDADIIQSANPAIERIFGYSRDALIGRNINILIPDSYSAIHREYISNSVKTGEPKDNGIRREFEGRRKDGTRVAVEMQITDFYIGEDHLLLGMVRDVTERKEIDRIKNEFLSTVSHELRTPLTSIKGSLGIVNAEALGKLPEKIKNMIQIAIKNADRLTGLVNDILDMEKLGVGSMEFDFEEADLRDVLRQAIEDNTGYAQEYGVEFVLKKTNFEAKVNVDVGRISQVMANLLSNAVKFSPQGAQVEISLARHDDMFRVSVVDHGIGVSKDFRDKIFGKFAQEDSSDSRKKGGTGLGLNITKSMIERHGGRIGFDSDVGVGSTFYFDLPERGRNEAISADK